MSQSAVPRLRDLPPVRYVRDPEPVHFPEEEEVPEGYVHLLLRTFLFELLQFVLGESNSVNSDQFVYWNARSPKRCLSPDVFVRMNTPQSAVGSWKTWERGGPPDLAVEIISPNEGDGIEWEEKLLRYHELGVRELIRFDPEDPPGARLRAWDRIKEDLVERQVEGETTHCATLRLTWAVRPIKKWPVALRLLDADGNLVLNEAETEARAREAETRAREAAEARVRELEEELRRRGG
ncbi:Uma2 family endonuclease [Pendulispora brunnea]|uniref:Uma2 family endonuclease n=1 Tax=Pendulispora brunnea TaxID=2905690 RepID=A0ABZ2KC24_9BACT